MNFNEHSEIEGRHAQFSPSKSSWLRYDDEKILSSYFNRNRTSLGTEIHEFAKSQIDLKQKVSGIKPLTQAITTYIYSKYLAKDLLDYGKLLIVSLNEIPEEVFFTVKLFINDAIGYRMSSEVGLKYSDRFFGTTDAISFQSNFLRIHDLKTGDLEAHIDQLLVYVALFCLEYKMKPSEFRTELRIYQFGKALVYEPGVDEIIPIMDKIITSEKLIKRRIDDEEDWV